MLHSEVRDKIRMPTLTTLIQHCTRGPGMYNKTSKRNKRYKDQKRGSKTIYLHMTYVCIFFNPDKIYIKTIRTINESLTKFQD